MLEKALKENPDSVNLRVTMSHLRLADGSPPNLLEEALRAILALDPDN